jgi:hypothetical protein
MDMQQQGALRGSSLFLHVSVTSSALIIREAGNVVNVDVGLKVPVHLGCHRIEDRHQWFSEIMCCREELPLITGQLLAGMAELHAMCPLNTGCHQQSR